MKKQVLNKRQLEMFNSKYKIEYEDGKYKITARSKRKNNPIRIVNENDELLFTLVYNSEVVTMNIYDLVKKILINDEKYNKLASIITLQSLCNKLEVEHKINVNVEYFRGTLLDEIKKLLEELENEKD